MVGALLSGCSSSAPPAAAPRRVGPYPLDHVLRLNQIQVLGTHNSYHLRPSSGVPGLWTDYEHPPLGVQLGTEGVRSVELDVSNVSGFTVEHDPYYDDQSNCPHLAACLGELRRWSIAHPRHAPIFVLVEAKDPSPVLDLIRDSWDADALDRLDAAVRSGLGAANLIAPDDVRGKAPTLRSAVRQHGWPTLEHARGKFVVILNRIKLRRSFLDGRRSLQGRAMFVPAYVNAPSAAIVERDKPVTREINRLVRQGFIVRTRADADGVEVQADDLTRSAIAIRSGAQIISTDYVVPDPSISPYVVRLPNGRPVRCNPVTAPKRCKPRDVEKQRKALA